MKYLIVLISLSIVFGVNTLSHQVFGQSNAEIVLHATVMHIGEPPLRDSGDVEVYQLVKYKIRRICKGEYKEKEIIVDHLLTVSDQLKDLRIGQKVCLTVLKSNSIGLRYNSEGIRNASDTVRFFYIAQKLKIGKSCDCLQ